jgi:hypothetical protein
MDEPTVVAAHPYLGYLRLVHVRDKSLRPGQPLLRYQRIPYMVRCGCRPSGPTGIDAVNAELRFEASGGDIEGIAREQHALHVAARVVEERSGRGRP